MGSFHIVTLPSPGGGIPWLRTIDKYSQMLQFPAVSLACGVVNSLREIKTFSVKFQLQKVLRWIVSSWEGGIRVKLVGSDQSEGKLLASTEVVRRMGRVQVAEVKWVWPPSLTKVTMGGYFFTELYVKFLMNSISMSVIVVEPRPINMVLPGVIFALAKWRWLAKRTNGKIHGKC